MDTNRLYLIRTKLSAYHFAKEALSKGERELLAIAEELLKMLDLEQEKG